MKKKIVLLLLLMSLFLFLENVFTRADSPELENDKEKLALILKKSAAYCEKLANSALFFVCRENIKEIIYQYPQGPVTVTSRTTGGVTSRSYRIWARPKKIVNNYTYDYQLVQRTSRIHESRTLLEENGEKLFERNARLKTQRFYSERSAFGPVGLISKEWQEMYDYKIIEEKTADVREILVIEAKPKRKTEEKPNYGKIWVDKEDFSIIKIEIEQESLAGIEELREKMKKGGLKPIIKVTHDYGTMKNGLRFPSKTEFTEDYAGTGRRIQKSRLSITYDNYRFFTVETEVKY